jgi:hypothetical protein
MSAVTRERPIYAVTSDRGISSGVGRLLLRAPCPRSPKLGRPHLKGYLSLNRPSEKGSLAERQIQKASRTFRNLVFRIVLTL